jgi:asparagine synthetase A
MEAVASEERVCLELHRFTVVLLRVLMSRGLGGGVGAESRLLRLMLQTDLEEIGSVE